MISSCLQLCDRNQSFIKHPGKKKPKEKKPKTNKNLDLPPHLMMEADMELQPRVLSLCHQSVHLNPSSHQFQTGLKPSNRNLGWRHQFSPWICICIYFLLKLVISWPGLAIKPAEICTLQRILNSIRSINKVKWKMYISSLFCLFPPSQDLGQNMGMQIRTKWKMTKLPEASRELIAFKCEIDGINQQLLPVGYSSRFQSPTNACLCSEHCYFRTKGLSNSSCAAVQHFNDVRALQTPLLFRYTPWRVFCISFVT